MQAIITISKEYIIEVFIEYKGMTLILAEVVSTIIVCSSFGWALCDESSKWVKPNINERTEIN